MPRNRTTHAFLACAPLACAAFAVLYIVAASEDPSYEVFESYLSDLGVGPGALAFNVGVAIAGCLLATFAIGGFRSYFGDNAITKTGASLLTVSGAFLVGVGVFTEDAGDTHLAVSYAFFVCAFLSLALLAAGRLLSLGSLIDPFVIASIASFVIGVAAVAVSGPDPFAETVAVFVLLTWGAVAPLTIAGHLGRESAK